MSAELSPLVDRGLRLARVDFAPAHRQPSGLRVVAALALSVAGSLAVDALLVTLGEAVFPSTKGFGHFQFNCLVRIAPVRASRGSAGSHARRSASVPDRFARPGS